MARECKIATRISTIECITPPGIGVDLRFIVVIGDQRSALSPPTGGSLSYAAPNITAVEPSRGVPTEGGLLTVIGTWGPCVPTCQADLDASGTIDVTDLLQVISDWN